MDYKRIEENKRIATEFYYNMGILKDPEGIKPFLGDKFIEHSQIVADGPESFVRFVKFRRDNFPEARNEIKMTIADTDKVMFHVFSKLTPDDPGRNIVDTFRIEDGKVVEHWNVTKPMEVLKYPPLTDNGIFNPIGDAILTDLDKTEENRKLVTELYIAYGIDHDIEKCLSIMGDVYIQHNPNVQDGPAHFARFVKWRREKYPEWKNQIKVTVAQGNLVGFHVHSTMFPGDAGRNLVDIYRVENGKVVEHWDTIMNVEVGKFPPLTDYGLF